MSRKFKGIVICFWPKRRFTGAEVVSGFVLTSRAGLVVGSTASMPLCCIEPSGDVFRSPPTSYET